jgi:hypothetical protein
LSITSLPQLPGWRGLSWAHRTWFAAVLLLSLAFLVAIPPFQTNDEPSHWRRLWSVACGQLTCGQPIPIVAERAILAADYADVRSHGQQFDRAAYARMRALSGSSTTTLARGNACVYVPIAYVLPALAMRPFVHPFDFDTPAGMLTAFFVSRLVNWLLMGVGVLLFVIFVPSLRNLTLVTYSLPTVMQQTVVVNQESTLFVMMLALVGLWAAPPRLRNVIIALVLITLLTAMKAVFLVLLLLWLTLVLRWRTAARVGWARVVAVLALALVPLVLQALWSHFVVRVSGKEFLPTWGVDPAAQVRFLRQHPARLVRMLWEGHKNLLSEKHMHGGWVSVLGVLGWAEFEIGGAAYGALLLALAVACLADVRAGAPAVAGSGWLRWVLPWISAYLLVPAVMLAMYLVFTAVAGASPLGVQGRYLVFPYFMMLAIPIDFVQRRWATARRVLDPLEGRVGGLLPWLCAALCLFADGAALEAIMRRFY